MPFTASHPAAVLPFMRTGLVPSALVIGSIAPDLPYFVPLPVSQSLSHSALGIVSVDLAMGLVAFLLWQVLIVPAAVALAPATLRARLAPDLPVPVSRHLRSVRRSALVAVSLVLGTISHVVWDSFTHEGRWGVDQLGVLSATHGPLAGYRWAQYASGLGGALVLVAALWSWWRRGDPALRGEREGDGNTGIDAPRIPAVTGRAAWVVWAAILLMPPTTGLLGFANAIADDRGTRRAFYRAATWGGATGILAVLLTAGAVTPVVRVRMRNSGRSARRST